jgi:hypothetical protein
VLHSVVAAASERTRFALSIGLPDSHLSPPQVEVTQLLMFTGYLSNLTNAGDGGQVVGE